MSKVERFIAEAEDIVNAAVDWVVVVLEPAPGTGIVLVKFNETMLGVPANPALVIKAGADVVVGGAVLGVVVVGGPEGGAKLTGAPSVVGIMVSQSVTVPWNHVNVISFTNVIVKLPTSVQEIKPCKFRQRKIPCIGKEGQDTINMRIVQD